MDFETTNRQHNKRIRAFEKLVKEIFNISNEEAIKLAKSVDYDAKKLFKFSDYPELRKKANKLFSQFQKDLKKVIIKGITSEWNKSNEVNNQLAMNILALKSIKDITDNQKRYFNNNDKALQAFIQRKTNGMNLSDRVWNLTQQYKAGLEQALTVGIADGRSAAELSRDIREYLNNPNKLFRRVRDFENRLNLSSKAKEYQPGQGIYRSSFKNALRLTGTEINMAYRTADYYRWLQLDFVVGVEIKLSNNHTIKDPKTGKSIPFYDICDELQGKYPKTFVFTGWHPNCYDEETEVLTKRGWQYFKYITKEDKIFSLNPETKETEWVEILLYFKRLYNGEMVHFYNRNLDCLVTPEHEVVYLNKSNQEIKRCKAIDFTMGKGAFFRGCKNNNNPIKTININGLIINFNLFCEFMGYWLSDGSTIRKSQICIAQQNDNRINIIKCIEQMGFKVSTNNSKIDFYSYELCTYLKQFKTAYYKFIPNEIKEASKEQIQIFLNAFISCDGYIRSKRTFKGNRGSLCVPKHDERMYFTTSPQMASDLGELILKIGKRPSYRINKNKNKIVKFKNGDYKLNYDLIVISECQSLTATQFNKELIDYHGYVYDVTLSKNAIMYIRRNGKCFWGSNCRCFAIPILKSREEFFNKTKSSREVKEIPQNFKEWISKNEERISKAKSIPYFIRDNKSFVSSLNNEANPLFKNVIAYYKDKVMYRGDIRDKGEKFKIDFKDYVSDNEAKNKAGFHWFTTSKEYAKEYATKQMNPMRGDIKKSIITEIKPIKELAILDLTKMKLKDEFEFSKSLYEYGIKGLMYKEETLSNYTGDYSKKSIEKYLGYKIGNSILNNGQIYSDGSLGVKFMEWLKENGFDGYKFQQYKSGDEIGLINASLFEVLKRNIISN